MTSLRFRNVDADPGDPLDTWPHEAFETAMERGLVLDWQRIADHIDGAPFGAAAATLAEVLEYTDGVAAFLLRDRLDQARRRALRRELAERTAALGRQVVAAGITQRELARRIGASESRLSTWLSGRQVPSAATVVKIQLALAEFVADGV